MFASDGVRLEPQLACQARRHRRRTSVPQDRPLPGLHSRRSRHVDRGQDHAAAPLDFGQVSPFARTILTRSFEGECTAQGVLPCEELARSCDGERMIDRDHDDKSPTLERRSISIPCFHFRSECWSMCCKLHARRSTLEKSTLCKPSVALGFRRRRAPSSRSKSAGSTIAASAFRVQCCGASSIGTASRSKKELARRQAAMPGRGRLDCFSGQPDLDPSRLIFIDETGASTNLARKAGRCRRGLRLRAAVPHGHYKTVTLVAGVRLRGLAAQKVFERLERDFTEDASNEKGNGQKGRGNTALGSSCRKLCLILLQGAAPLCSESNSGCCAFSHVAELAG